MNDKQIRISQEAYDQLEEIRGKDQSVGQVVDMLLFNRLKVLELFAVLEGQIKYRQWQDQRLRELETARY